MRLSRSAAWLASLIALALIFFACDDETSSGDPDGLSDLDDAAGDMTGEDTEPIDTAATDTGADTALDTAGEDSEQSDTDAVEPDTRDTSADTGADMGETCATTTCPTDQHCEEDASGPMCVDNTCADLTCVGTETCIDPPDDPAYCRDLACTADGDCFPEEFCGTDGLCTPDVCTPGDRRCNGDEVIECQPNGSESVLFTCMAGPTGLASTCEANGTGGAGCTCQDDWDCPTFTACEAGVCEGTGQAPMCVLPPQPFQSVPPNKEIEWGGLSRGNRTVTGAPYPGSGQVLMTPVVANLTDDNGDGRINELDFPEILFMTYNNGGGLRTNGVVRAIHAGGVDKGADYFANCDTSTWHEGESLPGASTCSGNGANALGGIAVGDLDADGVPEIVYPTENGGLRILDNKGDLVAETASSVLRDNGEANVAIANVDGAGFAEIIVGAQVWTVGLDSGGALEFVDRFDGPGGLPFGRNDFGPVSCVADIAPPPGQEIIGGSVAYSLPTPPSGATRRSDCTTNGGAIAPSTADETAWCSGELVVVWDVEGDNHPDSVETNLGSHRDGFCAVADVLGADETAPPSPSNPLDGTPEVVLIADGYLLVINGEQGILRRYVNLGGGGRGGAPNIDDFDGDGLPEIASALSAFYLVYDLQEPTGSCPAWTNTLPDDGGGLNGNTPRDPGTTCTTDSDCNAGAYCDTDAGQCVCLHNGWRQDTEDDSSRATSSSVFDFNGDGAAEVVYNDECYFRIYNGRDGSVVFKRESLSRTAIENPLVADVDNDGNAEIVFARNNEVKQCSENIDKGNGVGVWGDPTDTWVSARRIWNQHAYHVTNIREDGGVPVVEPPSWQPLNGRLYNTYRSQPRTGDVAPDLAVDSVQLVSPGGSCGALSDAVDIVTRIENRGDLRVGPGIVVGFFGTWGGTTEPLLDGSGNPLEVTLSTSLRPGASISITVSYDAANNTFGTLPDNVEVRVDVADVERECDETNNALSEALGTTNALADLRVELGVVDDSGCPSSATVETTVFNDGALDASDILVRYFAGDPAQGGIPIHEETVTGPLAAGMSTTFTATISNPPTGGQITVWAVVDPDDAIEECNDGNNDDAAGDPLFCIVN